MKVLCELCSLTYVLVSVLFLSCFIHSFIFNMQEQNNDLFQDLRIWSKVKLSIHAKQTKMEFSWSDHTKNLPSTAP